MAEASSSKGFQGEYQPDAWQIVVDALGYPSIHETDEDGRPGDLVAHCFADNEKLIVNAPRLRSALAQLLAVAGTPITARQEAVFAEARAVLADTLSTALGEDR